MLGEARAAVAVDFLDHCVDAIADAMRRERHATGVVEAGDSVPQGGVIGRHINVPAFMALSDRPRGRAVLEVIGRGSTTQTSTGARPRSSAISISTSVVIRPRRYSGPATRRASAPIKGHWILRSLIARILENRRQSFGRRSVCRSQDRGCPLSTCRGKYSHRSRSMGRGRG